VGRYLANTNSDKTLGASALKVGSIRRGGDHLLESPAAPISLPRPKWA